MCGEQQRTCSPSCNWESWGVCDGEGLCEPGETMCLADGGQFVGNIALLCNSLCEWENGIYSELCGASSGGGQIP